MCQRRRLTGASLYPKNFSLTCIKVGVSNIRVILRQYVKQNDVRVTTNKEHEQPTEHLLFRSGEVPLPGKPLSAALPGRLSSVQRTVLLFGLSWTETGHLDAV
jgi:hypothetical protein